MDRQSLLCLALAGLNTADALLTLFFVHTGVATELNPLMGSILEQSPAIFLLTKLVGVNGLVLAVWATKSRIARVPRLLVLAGYLYSLVVLYHIAAGLITNAI